MLQAFFHNDTNDKPHVHVWDTEAEMDVRSPFYSKQELRDWVYKTGTFNIHMCSMIGLPKV